MSVIASRLRLAMRRSPLRGSLLSRGMAGHVHREHFDAPAADKIWRPKPVAPYNQKLTETVEYIWPDASGPEPLVDNWQHVPLRRAFGVYFAIMGAIGVGWWMTPNGEAKVKDHSKTVRLGPDYERPPAEPLPPTPKFGWEHLPTPTDEPLAAAAAGATAKAHH